VNVIQRGALTKRLLRVVMAGSGGGRNQPETGAAFHVLCSGAIIAAGDRAKPALEALEAMSVRADTPHDVMAAFMNLVLEHGRQIAVARTAPMAAEGDDLF